MAKTPSTMLELGTTAPAFTLPDATGELHSFDASSQGEGFLVMFICNHCPFVIHLADSISEITKKYMAKGLAVFAINPNDIAKYPDDGPEKMIAEAKKRDYRFPYLLDESQAVAKSYRAACTPDFYLFDRSRKLVYRGQWDDSRPGNDVPVTASFMEAAIEEVLAERQPKIEQKPSLGCNIKWKPGQEPAWFG